MTRVNRSIHNFQHNAQDALCTNEMKKNQYELKLVTSQFEVVVSNVLYMYFHFFIVVISKSNRTL